MDDVRDSISVDNLVTLLALLAIDITEDVVSQWDDDQFREVEHWAMQATFDSGAPMPEFLKEYQEAS